MVMTPGEPEEPPYEPYDPSRYRDIASQLAPHEKTIWKWKKEGKSVQEMAERFYDMGVRHPYSGRNSRSEIATAIRQWLYRHMSPIERIEERILRLAQQLADAEATRDALLAAPEKAPPSSDPGRLTRARNWGIYDRRKAGETIAKLAKEFHLSRDRIRQIFVRCEYMIGRVQKHPLWEGGGDKDEALKRVQNGQQQD